MGNSHSAAYGVKPRKNVHWKTAEKPGTPGKPQIIPSGCEDEPNAVTLRWTVPGHDGGAPLLGFQVECNRIGSPAWIHTSPPIINKPELILTGLEGGYQYQFRVSAVNAVSASEASELSDILTISSDRTAFIAPKFLNNLTDVVSLENETSTFKATFEGVPPPTVAWFKDGFEIFSSRRTVISSDDNSSVLIFHQTLLSDEGEIKCTATNRAGHAVSRARLALNAPPKLRYPRQYEDGLLYEVNETIFLKTSVVGQPMPRVVWLHDGCPLRSDSRIEITTTAKLSALKIRAAQRTDRGEYQVHARNEIGEDCAAFLVTVTAPPEPPRRLAVARQIDKSVTLTWSPPEDDGGCRVGNYVLEYYRSGWDVWLKATTSRKLSATLFDLIEGSEYRFRVKAESPYGMSEPSAESAPVRIPGESINSDFLAVESRIIADALLREDGDETHAAYASPPAPPLASPRRKKSELNTREAGAAKERSPTARVGSSEFMIVLCPEQKKTHSDKRKSFQLDLEEALSPPPLSYSAPELNTRYTPFAPLRNSVSSTELLHERAMDRFYQAVAMKEEIINRQKCSQNETSQRVNKKPAEELPTKVSTLSPKVETVKNNSPGGFLTIQEPASHWQSRSFDDDYTASTVSTAGSEQASKDTSLDRDLDRFKQLHADEDTYRPREKLMRSPSPPNEMRVVEMLTKPAPLPDPNFVPKPILKRRENEISEISMPAQERKLEKITIFKKITKMPEMPKITKSFTFTKKENKKDLKKLNIKLDTMETIKPNAILKGKINDKDDKELDEGRIVIEHYGNIVREFGCQKKNPVRLLINTEELKKAAEEQKQNISNEIYTTKPKKPKPQKIVREKPKAASKTKTANNVPKQLNAQNKSNDVVAKFEKKQILGHKVVDKCEEQQLRIQQVVLKTAARASIVIPINYEQLEQQAKHSVRSAIDCTIDLCLLLLAFWFYFFKDERLSIPLLILLIYRQVQQVLFRNIPAWINRHTPDWIKKYS